MGRQMNPAKGGAAAGPVPLALRAPSTGRGVGDVPTWHKLTLLASEQEPPPPAVSAVVVSRVFMTKAYRKILWACRFISLSSGYILS